MQNFSIGKQIELELDDFKNKKVKLASYSENESVRVLSRKQEAGYYFNQGEMVSLIDLYYNSQFSDGPKDTLGQKKIFLNVGKFRTDVSAKQIDIDTNNFKFTPDDYSDPWTSIFLEKDFKEWTKETDWGDMINQCVENFPKYGSVVLKKVGREIKWVPLQNLRNEQTAESLQTASYAIEEHPDMFLYEMKAMKGWNTSGFNLKFGQTSCVFERYGHVPLNWLKANDGLQREIAKSDEGESVDAMVITAKDPETKQWHLFYVGQIKERPYREAHWNKQHGRWLGCGVMEDLLENQKAKNIIINLIRRGLSWATKKIFSAIKTDGPAKNLVRDVADGAVIEVGPNGEFKEITMSPKSNADFTNFLNEFEKNSDQKAFTYDVATGESMPSGTPFRLGVVLSNAVNSFFSLKREKLGKFLRKVIIDFMIPQFLREMSDEKKVVSMFSGQAGFEVLKEAAIKMVQSEAARISLLSGKSVDATSLAQATDPFLLAKTILFSYSKEDYLNASYKFDLTVTGEEIDIADKIETLKTIYQLIAPTGDPRAEAILDKIAGLSGEEMSQFGPAPDKRALAPGTPPTGTPALPSSQGNPNAVPA